MAKELQEEDCLQILKKCLQTTNFHLKRYEIVDFHNPLQGYVGEHFTLKIDYEQTGQKTQSFFVKTLNTNTLMLEFSKFLQVYEKESFFYGLLEKMEQYNIDTSYAPKGFYFKPYTVVLEDLSQEYVGTPKCKLLDLDHCKSCLETLAKFHASSVIFEKKTSSLKNAKILDDKFLSSEDNIVNRWISGFVQGLFQLIDLMPENHITNESFKNKLLEVVSEKNSLDGTISGILHGDLWSSNFLHVYENSKPIRSKLLDFQFVKYGFLEADVAEFLVTNTSRKFRDENFDFLVEYYYNKLEKCLNEAKCYCLPNFESFRTSCNNFKLPAALHATLDHSYTFMSDEIFKEAFESEDNLRKFLFEERGRFMFEAYKNSEDYRNRLSEDIYELKDLLFC